MGNIARWAAVAVLSAAWATPVLAQNPLAPGPKPAASNPLAQKPDPARAFIGTFEGKNISLLVQGIDARGELTGVLEFQGKQYPVNAREKDGVMVGKFTVDGNGFDLTATLNGDAMTLSSAGENYALTRKAARNPLAGGGNPLGGGPQPPRDGPPNRGPDAPVANDAPAGGVGISFQPNADGALVIAAILPGSPAAKAGLKPGGVLQSVDGKQVAGLKPEEVRGLIGGKPGSIVTLLIVTQDEIMDVVLERADISKLLPPPPGQQQPGNPGRDPAPGPGPMPGGQGGFAPPPALPGGGGPNAAVPAWMKPGVRASFWAGSASVASAGAVLVPDDKGNWTTTDGKTWSVQNNPGAGGMGYQQFTVANLVGDSVVVDFKQYLFNPEAKAYTTVLVSGHTVKLNEGGELWMPPQKLAQMQEGNVNGVRISRGPYTLNNKTYNAVGITTVLANGGSRYTYDAETGILLAMGSSSVGAGMMSAPLHGQTSPVAGNTQLVQIIFAGMRQTNLPWIGQRAPAELTQTRQVDFQGTYTSAVANAGQVSWPVAMRWDISRIDEYSLQMRQTYKIDYGNTGMPNEPQVSDRGGSVAALWIDPRTLGQLRQGQVIDEDPITQMRTVVTGVQNGNVVLAEQGQIETSAWAYNQQTGAIQTMQLEQQVGLGKTVVQVQRTR